MQGQFLKEASREFGIAGLGYGNVLHGSAGAELGVGNVLHGSAGADSGLDSRLDFSLDSVLHGSASPSSGQRSLGRGFVRGSLDRLVDGEN